MSEKFEDIEHEQFGEEGFDDAVRQIAGIQTASAHRLGTVTAPPPPKV